MTTKKKARSPFTFAGLGRAGKPKAEGTPPEEDETLEENEEEETAETDEEETVEDDDLDPEAEGEDEEEEAAAEEAARAEAKKNAKLANAGRKKLTMEEYRAIRLTERRRIQEIMSHEAGHAHPQAAGSMAFGTNMTAASVIEVLEGLPKAKKQKPATAEDGGPQPSAFAKAMAKHAAPAVGVGAKGAGAGAKNPDQSLLQTAVKLFAPKA
jgi:hypothetical protein